MTQQYLRQLSLVVANAEGKGIELGAFRVVFEVRRGDTQTPNSCDARIYNLSTNTARALGTHSAFSCLRAEFTQLLLKVAYQGQPLAQIFHGSIKQVRLGREDQKNSYVAITAADGDEAYNFAPVAFTLSKGNLAANAVTSILGTMALAAQGGPTGGTGGQPISQGYMPQFNPNQFIRGRVYFGSARDEMRDFAKSQDCKWWFDNGKLSVVPLTSYISSAPILITPSTGLIGVPEQTQNGLSVRVLMNPAIKIGATIKLDSTDINQLRFGLDNQSVANNLTLQQGADKLNGDGLYYVMRAEHFGDTRGTAWYTDLTCLAVDATVTPPASVAQAAVARADAIPRY